MGILDLYRHDPDSTTIVLFSKNIDISSGFTLIGFDRRSNVNVHVFPVGSAVIVRRSMWFSDETLCDSRVCRYTRGN